MRTGPAGVLWRTGQDSESLHPRRGLPRAEEGQGGLMSLLSFCPLVPEAIIRALWLWLSQGFHPPPLAGRVLSGV